MKLELDLSYLNEISDGDKEFIVEVLHTFLQEMPKDIAELSKAINESNILMIGKMAHKTKATLHTLGLYDLKELAAKIEQTAKSNPTDKNIISMSKSFIQYINQVYPIVEKML